MSTKERLRDLRKLGHGSWYHMRTRCLWPKSKDYANYGGRGIKVCPQWDTFERFLADMGPRPEGMTLERKDTNGDYCPENCCWIPRPDQGRNTRRTIWVEVDDGRVCLSVALKSHGVVSSTTAHRRIGRGWNPLDAITTPARPKRKSAAQLAKELS